MDKVKVFQKLPGIFKTIIASYRGYQLKILRSKNRNIYLAEIRERDFWNKEQIRKFQETKCREMLDHAVRNVPYYRNLWNSIHKASPGLDPLDLNNWPVLEKDAIRNHPDLFIADGIRKEDLTFIPTSGTSGKPMQFYFDRYTISYWYAMYEYRIRNWNGVSETDRWANVGGQLICDIRQQRPPFWTWNAGMNQLYLSSYHITPENVPHYIRALKKYHIQSLLGYVSSMYNIASEALKQNLEIPKLKLIITTAEPLYDYQRTLMESAFGCKVVQTYSSCEFSFGSNEDPDRHMYIWPEAGITEIVDETGQIIPEGKGELITTGLLNKAMPLIRYRIGDTVKLNRGMNGKMQFDYFEEVIGRTDDLVVTSGGKFVGRLDPVFKSNIRIRESQIIQEDFSEFTIRVVPDKDFGEEDMQSIESRLKDRVGNDVTVRFEVVDEIPRGPNGKFKAVVSKITREKLPGVKTEKE